MLNSLTKLLLLPGILLLALESHAVELLCHAPQYVGQSASLFIIEDYLSGERTVIGTAEVPESGTFTIRASIDQTRELILSIGFIEGILFASPEDVYEVRFPVFRAGDVKRFDRATIDLEFIGVPDKDLNVLIRAFNADYSRFIRDHFYDFAIDRFKGSDTFIARMSTGEKGPDLAPAQPGNQQDTTLVIVTPAFGDVVLEFQNQIQLRYSPFYDNVFFRDYVMYSCAELDILSGKLRKNVYQDYLMSRPVLHRNPAYIKFIELFYQGFITERSEDFKAEVYKAVNAEKSARNLMGLFANDSLAASDNIRGMAIILSLRDVYYQPEFSRSAVEQTLIGISKAHPDQQVCSTAGRVARKMQRCKAGWPIEDFTLLDKNNDPWTFSEQKNRYIYVVFFADWCNSCKKELQVMQRFTESYGKDIQFVAISMDNNYDAFINYQNEHRDQNFVFLFGGSDPLIREKFNLRAIPMAMLIDPEGKVVMDYTRRPSEGIQIDFDKIKKKNQEGGGGTWRDRQ